MTEQQLEKLQVCENKCVKRIAGVKRIDKRRMEELREEVGVKETLTRKLVRCRLKWAGNNGRGTVDVFFLCRCTFPRHCNTHSLAQGLFTAKSFWGPLHSHIQCLHPVYAPISASRV